MTNNTDKKDQKRMLKRKDIHAKRSKVTFEEDNNDHGDDNDDFDQDEIDKVLQDQEFPTRKVSNKKKSVSEKDTIKSDTEDSEGAIQPAITYLLSWKEKTKDWKFKKLRQTWLLQSMYDKEKVSKAHFKILLDYLEDLKGASREQTLQEAKEFVENNEDTEECTDKRKLKRALKVLKVLT